MGAQSFTSLMTDLRQDINRVSLFSRCLNGTFPWRCLVSWLRREDLYFLLFSIGLMYQVLTEQFLQRNVPLGHLLNEDILFIMFMSWQWSVIKEVNDLAPYLSFFKLSIMSTNSRISKTMGELFKDPVYYRHTNLYTTLKSRVPYIQHIPKHVSAYNVNMYIESINITYRRAVLWYYGIYNSTYICG